jgi:Tol biopolymer transport system component
VVDEKFGLAVYDLRDSTAQMIVPGQSSEDTEWSPNGREIFLSKTEVIYRYSFDDSSFVQIATSAKYPSVSPDGQRIVFLRHTWWEYAPETNGHLYIMDRDGGNMHQITFWEGGDE